MLRAMSVGWGHGVGISFNMNLLNLLSSFHV